MRNPLKKQVSEDYVLVLGFGMMSLGFFAHLYWIIMGGFMIFFLGTMNLPLKHQDPDSESHDEPHS